MSLAASARDARETGRNRGAARDRRPRGGPTTVPSALAWRLAPRRAEAHRERTGRERRGGVVLRGLFALWLAVLVGGCVGEGGIGVAPGPDGADRPVGGVVEELGSGGTAVALLLPIGAGGSASGLAEAFRNATELALAQTATQRIRVLVIDTEGTDTGGRRAAEAAVEAGAGLVLGPVFSHAVSGAAGPARRANVPVIAFSTDAAVAGDGVWLLSFLPRQDVSRIVGYATAEGAEAIAALVPDNGYGLVVEAAFRSEAARHGATVAAVERYADRDDLAAKARALASAGTRVDAVFVPNGGEDPTTAARTLFENGLERSRVRMLGSGQWDSPAVIGDEALVGGWYPGPAKSGFADFSERYRSRYGAPPPRTASLVYDAVMLANGLVQAHGPAAAFARARITSPDGFLGIDGVFRFTGNGLSQRGLAVFVVEPGGSSRVVSPAPDRFDRGNF